MEMLNCFKKSSKVIIDVLKEYDLSQVILLGLTPIVVSFLNWKVHLLLEKESDNIAMCILWKVVYDYFTFFIQSSVMHKQTMKMFNDMVTRINLAKVKCGTPIPGVNQKQHKDLCRDCSKLRDFLFVIPILWSSVISYGLSIYFMETNSDLPIRFIFTVICICMVYLLTYLTDVSLYERTKPSKTKITRFDDSNYVKIKMSMGCVIDTEFESNKQKKKEEQQNIQKYCICIINLIITLISLMSGNKGQLHAFGKISWMLGSLADNLKSLLYYEYVDEFLVLTKCLEKHQLYSEKEISIGLIDRVVFDNVSFGYYSDDLTKNPQQIPIINGLSFELEKGKFYYLKSPNGSGKSTFLKALTSNLFRGDIYFGNTNRKNLSFEDVNSSIFHIVQATEYTPKFNPDEIRDYVGRDVWLEEQLGLSGLLGKDTVELSGGQKKRLFIYITLTSSAQILLFDEILSELDTEETKEVPEGGGWLTRVINTLVNWRGGKNKIIILVGHESYNIIPSKVIKLKIENSESRTYIKQIH